jgi:preprotein translocase subunit YajC
MQVVLNTIMLQAAPGGNPMMSVILMVGMFAVMYFFMLRPQSKRAKEQKAFADSMNAGEYVITTAGIHGTIQRANEDGTLQLEIARGTFIKIERQAISMETTMAYRKKNDKAAVVETAK